MKKIVAFIAVIGILSLGNLTAQNEDIPPIENEQPEMVEGDELETSNSNDTSIIENDSIEVNDNSNSEVVKVEEGDKNKKKCESTAEGTPYQQLKKKFIEGGPMFMACVLICLILGLALCIERIIYLNLATTNTKKLLENIEQAMQNGGVDAAKEVCRNTRGPVASIFYQGLERSSEGIEMVEKGGMVE